MKTTQRAEALIRHIQTYGAITVKLSNGHWYSAYSVALDGSVQAQELGSGCHMMIDAHDVVDAR